jgi:single-stranded DNA-binding protein
MASINKCIIVGNLGRDPEVNHPMPKGRGFEIARWTSPRFTRPRKELFLKPIYVAHR